MTKTGFAVGILVGLAILLVVGSVGLAVHTFVRGAPGGGESEIARRGQIGDFYGGHLAGPGNLAGVLLLVAALALQQQQTAAQTRESKANEMLAKQRASHLQVQVDLLRQQATDAATLNGQKLDQLKAAALADNAQAAARHNAELADARQSASRRLMMDLLESTRRSRTQKARFQVITVLSQSRDKPTDWTEKQRRHASRVCGSYDLVGTQLGLLEKTDQATMRSILAGSVPLNYCVLVHYMARLEANTKMPYWRGFKALFRAILSDADILSWMDLGPAEKQLVAAFLKDESAGHTFGHEEFYKLLASRIVP